MKSWSQFIMVAVAAFAVSAGWPGPSVLLAGPLQQVEGKPKAAETKKKKKKSGESSKVGTTQPGDSEADVAAANEKPNAFPKGKREKQFKTALGEEYKVQRTDHFFVIYNADEEVVKDFIARLERTYDSVHRFATQLNIKITYPKEKLPVVFCNDFAEYDRRCKQLVGMNAPPEAAGLYFHEPFNFSLFYDVSQADFIKVHAAEAKRLKEEAKTTKDPNERKNKTRQAEWILNKIDTIQQQQNRSVVQHEVAHQLLFNLGVHLPGVDNPQWFTEGLATQFEPPPNKLGAGFNIVNQERLQEYRESYKDTAPDLRALVGRSREGMLTSEGYALAWALTYYVVKQKSKALPEYVELLKQRKTGEAVSREQQIADFEKCFGKLDSKFTKQWSEFIKKIPYRPPH